MSLPIAFLLLIVVYAAVSKAIERTMITAPIVFTLGGMAAYWLLPPSLDLANRAEIFLPIAEIGLSLLLFADASRTDRGLLRRIRNLPTRLLGPGMLLTIVLGAVAAIALFPDLSLWEAGILAAILAPTDAGLGQVIVNSPRVPRKIGQALNVEAGLNDGLSVPFLLFFIALSGGGEAGSGASLGGFLLEQLGIGAIVGLVIGWSGGALLGWSSRRGWLGQSWAPLGTVVLPLICILAAEATGSSMFIAAFVAGLAVQVRFEDAPTHSIEFTEDWGQLFNLSVFFLFGWIVAGSLPGFDLRCAVYAVLSLTVVRMVPVAIALLGTRLSFATVVFVGWFGPRGLASIVLGLVYLEQASHSGAEPTIRLAVIWTVLISIFAHGLTAQPGIKLFARAVDRLPLDAPENDEATPSLARADVDRTAAR